jgi:hypothetical protein
MLEMEGSKTKDPPQGCQSSVLRISSEGRIDELCGIQENISYILTNSNWFTLQFISLIRQTKEQLRGFHLSWTIVQLKTNLTNHQCLISNDYFDCSKSSTNINETSFCIHRSLICDGYIHCQPLSNNDELPSHCLEISPLRSRFKPSVFLRQHYILILIIFILSIVILSISIILIFLMIKTKRRTQKEILSKEKKKKSSTKIYLYNDDDNDDQDLSGMNMIEQAVTTV